MPEAVEPVVVRNSRMVIAGMFIFAVASFLLAAGAAAQAIYELLEVHGHTFVRLLSVMQWAGVCLGIGWIGVFSWRQAMKSRFHEVRLESDGVHFRLGTRKKPFEAFFAWSQIAAVTAQARPDNQYVFVSGKDGREVNYTAYDIFRYKKVAREIASRAGVELGELKAVRAYGKKAK